MFNIFNVDVDSEFLFLFVWLLAGSAWIWIIKWRVELLSQQPSIQLQLHAFERTFAGILISFVSELLMIGYLCGTLKGGKKVELMTILAFEHGVLTLSAVSTSISFILSLTEASNNMPRLEPGAFGRTLSMTTGTFDENDDETITEKWAWWMLFFDVTKGEMSFVGHPCPCLCLLAYTSSIADIFIRVYGACSQRVLHLCLLRRVWPPYCHTSPTFLFPVPPGTHARDLSEPTGCPVHQRPLFWCYRWAD